MYPILVSSLVPARSAAQGAAVPTIATSGIRAAYGDSAKGGAQLSDLEVP